MTTPENPIDNPFDTTIWDPTDHEHAIEDPLHGPSAVVNMLAVPPMPLGDRDGTYLQPGGFYARGTSYFDAEGRPKPEYRLGSAARSMTSVMREMYALDEWRKASRQGEDALTALEARRQQERLDRTGAAHAFRPTDVCGGGKRLDERKTASAMIEAAGETACQTEERTIAGDGKVWNVMASLGRSCTTCALSCEVAYETYDGAPTGIIRFTSARPLESDFPVVRIDPLDE